MRQFNSINDEVEVGYDEKFEHRWRYVTIVGRLLMLLVVVAAMIGLFGQGPYSHHSLASASGRLRVDFEPIARFGNVTQITFHLKPVACDGGMTIRVNGNFVEPMGLQLDIPQPVSSIPTADGMLLHFDLDPARCQNALVRLFAKPSGIGPVLLQAQLDRDPMLSWHVFVVP